MKRQGDIDISSGDDIRIMRSIKSERNMEKQVLTVASIHQRKIESLVP